MVNCPSKSMDFNCQYLHGRLLDVARVDLALELFVLLGKTILVTLEMVQCVYLLWTTIEMLITICLSIMVEINFFNFCPNKNLMFVNNQRIL